MKQSVTPIPLFFMLHACHRLGNLGDIGKAGSLHEFLVKLHNDYVTLASFYWGKQQAVSIASPELFKQSSKLFDRPGEI